ncbi:ATP-binding protein [Chitinophaga sp. 30R24]|uniref:ATP-binding protein n=1 Tax=Chitinophaga sp. 30R24 TaxID=3248838 RepID=UPI003B91D748
MPEQHNIEYKLSWRDEYLKWICGFANAQGGQIFIGIDDNSMIVGVDDHKKLMDDIPNKAVNHLGLVVDVNLHKSEGKHYIEIKVPVSSVPIAYHGIYHYRSGSTKQELKGIALQNLLLKKIGKKWENIPLENTSISDINETTVRSFIIKSIQKDRIPTNSEKMEIGLLLKNLNLMTEDGQLTNASILLFGKNPAKVTVTASFKIGRFGTSSHDLLYQDIIETNIFDMADRVIEILKMKYLIRPISYKGIERLEPLEYPESALREAILNAIIHKDYSSTYIFLKVYDDRLHLWNPGNLPEELSLEKLRTDHSSYPRNRNIANVFFKAGYIESWGRGINKIIDSCIEGGLPAPLIEEEQGGFGITLFKENRAIEWVDVPQPHNERQAQAIKYIKEHTSITNMQYQELNNISKRTATRDLQELIKQGVIQKVGTTGKGTTYVFTYQG